MAILGTACTTSSSKIDQAEEGQEEAVETAASSPHHSVGDPIDPEGAVSVGAMMEKLQQEGRVPNIKVRGEVVGVCKKKGCWMVITDGVDSVRVIFKDYGFFVPKDIEGYIVAAEGEAYYDTFSVAEQRHIAEDAGKSAEEIAAITEDIVTPMFEARGVVIFDYPAKGSE